ncbi:MAG: class I SAM-dependent methyltransferase [Candidatus Marinimicrobia bacterium]|nr:class I SAM-dependent methyltransferase [Candidatus Neomarinimicrobiota bacterium]
MNFLIPCPICDEKTRLTSFVWFNQKIISCKICNMFYCPKIIYREIDSNSTPTPDENLSMLLNTFDECKIIASEKCKNRIYFYEKLKGSPLKNVMEIGSGPGICYSTFKDNDISWIGLEINRKWLDWGQKQNIPIKNNKISDYKECFDLIYACQVLEHFENPKDLLKDIINALRPGGLLHFEVPNHNSLISSFRKISPIISKDYGCIQPVRHMRAYSYKSMKKLFEIVDMKIKLLSPYPNNHHVWGQIRIKQPIINRISYRLSNVFNLGSLLVGIAQKNN